MQKVWLSQAIATCNGSQGHSSSDQAIEMCTNILSLKDICS